MNEVKKSLDALSGITSQDMEEVKRGVLSGKRRQKKRNPFPAVVIALVTAVILFFAFNVLQDGYSTADDDAYEVNELIYDFVLRTVSDGNEDEATSETKQAVLQNILKADALIDYAKSLGYEEETAAIEEIVAEQRDGYYAELDKEGEERKNTILQQQEKYMGISYDEYFNVMYKWTIRYEKAYEWLVRYPQENPKTYGEVLGLFQNKYERAIDNFMEQKSISPFDLSVKYEELAGTVAAIEENRALVTHGFVEDAPSKKEKLIVKGAASRFVIEDASDEISPGMDIRVVYDSLASPVTSHGLITYEKVKEWGSLSGSAEREFLATNATGVSEQDIVTAYVLCVSALSDYYKAVWNGTDIDLNSFIENENLKQYTQKKIESQHALYGKNDPMKDIGISDWKADYTDDADGGYLYLYMPVEINKFQGGYGEVTEILVRNVNGKLVIVDWYTGAKDSYDFIIRGENETIDDPKIWNDNEWVKRLESKLD
ncbi:hypothetical protein [Sporosarcina sp. UB5]|uniref:hypothetical protein n=1 Tax=Sporosarcina sp. UB5 TaxID=3047463 RepID=UPI003D7A0E02